MKNKFKIIFALCYICFLFSGCNSSKIISQDEIIEKNADSPKSVGLLNDKIKLEDITSVQFVQAMGNPEYGGESKIITHKDEINNFVDAFNNAIVREQVEEKDIGIADFANCYLFSGSKIVREFIFNVNDTERVLLDSKFYYIKYTNKTPWELYEESKAEKIIVDEDLNEIIRPK